MLATTKLFVRMRRLFAVGWEGRFVCDYYLHLHILKYLTIFVVVVVVVVVVVTCYCCFVVV